MAPALAKALANDWADDLGGYPVWAVKVACDRYRRGEPMRAPKPASIIVLAEEEIEGEKQEMREMELALSAEAAKPEPEQATREQVAAILESHGHHKAVDEAAAEKERKRQPSPGQLAMRRRAHEAAMETFRRTHPEAEAPAEDRGAGSA